MRSKDEETSRKIIEIIDDYHDNGYESPTIQQIADMLKLNKSTVSRYITYLVGRGVLEKNSRFGDLKTPKMQRAQGGNKSYPVVGTIACGTPMLAEENIQSYVTFSKDFLGAGDFFLLKASGNSMINAGIDDGDLVVVKQQETAEQGQIIVALMGNEATLKRYYLDSKKKKIRLHPENDSMKDILCDSISIQGIAVKVIKDLQ